MLDIQLVFNPLFLKKELLTIILILSTLLILILITIILVKKEINKNNDIDVTNGGKYNNIRK